MREFTIRTDRIIRLPFLIEADSHGGSSIREEEGKIYFVNRLDGQVIEHREITEEEARRTIRETLSEPVDIRFPPRRRPRE